MELCNHTVNSPYDCSNGIGGVIFGGCPWYCLSNIIWSCVNTRLIVPAIVLMVLELLYGGMYLELFKQYYMELCNHTLNCPAIVLIVLELLYGDVCCTRY